MCVKYIVAKIYLTYPCTLDNCTYTTHPYL